jgi:hypothetical protein
MFSSYEWETGDFILKSPENYTTSLLIQLCFAGLYGIIFIAYMIANEHTATTEEKRQYQILYIKDASIKIKTLLEKINHKEAKKSVERLYDALYLIASSFGSPCQLRQQY